MSPIKVTCFTVEVFGYITLRTAYIRQLRLPAPIPASGQEAIPAIYSCFYTLISF